MESCFSFFFVPFSSKTYDFEELAECSCSTFTIFYLAMQYATFNDFIGVFWPGKIFGYWIIWNWFKLKKKTNHFGGLSSSLSEIVMTDTAGEGVSWIVIVCCREFWNRRDAVLDVMSIAV